MSIKLDSIPGYNPKGNKQSFNPNKKVVALHLKTRSATINIPQNKQEISSESEEIKRAREDLEKNEAKL